MTVIYSHCYVRVGIYL